MFKPLVAPRPGGIITYRYRISHVLYTHRHTYVRTYVGTYVHIYIHTDAQAHIHTDRPTDRPTDRQTDIHTHIHIYPHTRIHTHTHTYIHTHIYTLRNTPKGDDEMRWNENSCFLLLGFWLCPVAILRLLQVHTVDQTVHPTPRHSFIALGLPRSAQCPCSLVY